MGASDDLAGYAELCVTSIFTFSPTGASHPEELVARAAELGLAAIAITDRNSLAGVVRAHSALREIARGLEGGGVVTIRGQVVHDPSSCQTRGGAGLALPPRVPKLVIGVRAGAGGYAGGMAGVTDRPGRPRPVVAAVEHGQAAGEKGALPAGAGRSAGGGQG